MVREGFRGLNLADIKAGLVVERSRLGQRYGQMVEPGGLSIVETAGSITFPDEMEKETALVTVRYAIEG